MGTHTGTASPEKATIIEHANTSRNEHINQTFTLDRDKYRFSICKCVTSCLSEGSSKLFSSALCKCLRAQQQSLDNMRWLIDTTSFRE